MSISPIPTLKIGKLVIMALTFKDYVRRKPYMTVAMSKYPSFSYVKKEEQNAVLLFYIENRSIVCFKSVACFSRSFNN